MEKNSQNFHGMDMDRAMQLAQTDQAKQLFALLQSGSSNQLQSAMNQAAAGNLGQAKQILEQMMASDQAKELMRQLWEQANG